MRFRIPDSEVVNLIARWMPTQDHMTALAVFAHQQVKDRHETQGASGGTPWPQKVMKSLGYDDGRAILTGPSAKMLLSWFSYGEVNGSIGRAVTANDQSYSFVHELGTEGKGLRRMGWSRTAAYRTHCGALLVGGEPDVCGDG